MQEAIADSILIKLSKAVKKLQPKMVLFGGGVSANKRLRTKSRKMLRDLGVPVYFPATQFCTDNGAMIALAAYHKFLRGEIVKDVTNLHRDPSITIETPAI